MDKGVIYFKSPIGFIQVQCENEKIVNLKIVEEKKYDERVQPVLLEAKAQLNDYFSGKRKTFDLPLQMNGTDFQKKVWNQLIEIPYGETASYKDVAVAIGNGKASRAVGNANNKNKIPIIVPCHRVIGSNGKLVGFEYGLWRKEWLLEHENKNKNKNF